MKEQIHTDGSYKGIGPYSQAVRANGFLFVSGQLAWDDSNTGRIIAGGIDAQVEQVMKNLTAILTAAGSSWANVVKTTVFLKDMNNFARMNDVYERFLEGIPPCRTAVEAARLPKDVLVEIDVIALA